jgi:pimeloyl-ACP methyl ester carboxylesterase
MISVLFALLSTTALAKPTTPPAPTLTEASVVTNDGKTLTALAGAPKGATNGVLLVHMAGHSKEEFLALAEKFLRQGLVVVAIDLRGHGGNVKPEDPALTPADWLSTIEDVRAGVAALKTRGAQRVAIVGAEVGANLALVVGSEDPAVASVALLSPGLDYKVRSTTALDSLSPGPHTVQTFEAAGKGTKMFGKEPMLEGQILGFVSTSWSVVSGPVAPSELEVKTSTTTLQTSGPKLGGGEPAPAPQ